MTDIEHRSRTPRSVFVPTPQDIVEKMLELAKVQKTDVVYDLGSVDGRIVITAAEKYGCRAVGVAEMRSRHALRAQPRIPP